MNTFQHHQHHPAPHPRNGSAPTSGKDDEAAKGEKRKADSTLVGIKSARQIRALRALLTSPITREQLDRVAGASNSPDVVAALRRRGLAIVCNTVEVTDRDGRKTHPGVYRLDPAHRARAAALLDASEVAA